MRAALAGFYALQQKDPTMNVPMERIERAHDLWFNSTYSGEWDDFWRLPPHEIRLWLDKAEEEEKKPILRIGDPCGPGEA